MNKKIISVILVLSSIFGILFCSNLSISAEENIISGNVNIIINGNAKRYNVLNKNDILYMSGEDFAEISGYEYAVGDYISLCKPGKKEALTAINIQFDGSTTAMGKNYTVDVISENGKYYFPIEKILYLLHAQWFVQNNSLYIQPLKYSILDYWYGENDNFAQLYNRRVTQKDLLINGENEFEHNVRTSLAAVFNDFDPMMFVLWWPGEGIAPQYKQGI